MKDRDASSPSAAALNEEAAAIPSPLDSALYVAIHSNERAECMTSARVDAFVLAVGPTRGIHGEATPRRVHPLSLTYHLDQQTLSSGTQPSVVW